MRLFGPMIVLMLVEIALFITLGGAIGLLASLGIILGTGILGSAILRQTGANMAVEMRAAMSGGALPGMAGDHGLRMLAGVLLILPGFLGDMLGGLLLIGPLRRWIAGKAANRLRPTAGFGVHPRPDVVIDAEFIELDPSETPPRGPSGWTRH
ncbi:MAG: FxsA family protein [Gemmobacter sp.]|nr:FxsA family protein [Gemmobacter sp.]